MVWLVGFVFHEMDKARKGKEGKQGVKEKKGREKKKGRRDGGGNWNNQKPWASHCSSIAIFKCFQTDEF